MRPKIYRVKELQTRLEGAADQIRSKSNMFEYVDGCPETEENRR